MAACAEAAQEDEEESLWTRRYRFGGLAGGTAHSLCVHEEFGAGLGGTVWAGSVGLARYLSEQGGAASVAAELCTRGVSEPLRALELGAGCSALPGLLLAQTGAFASVLLADRDDCVPRLRQNVQCNAHSCGATELLVADVDWGAPEALRALPGYPFHLVLAADVAYGMTPEGGPRAARAAEALCCALVAVCSERGVMLLAQLCRPLHEESLFYELPLQSFIVRRVDCAQAQDGDHGLGIFRLDPRAQPWTNS